MCKILSIYSMLAFYYNPYNIKFMFIFLFYIYDLMVKMFNYIYFHKNNFNILPINY